MKEIENATQIHTDKYIQHVPNRTTITSMREKVTDKYEKWQKYAHTQAVGIELSRRWDREPSTLRMFCRLKACVYKKAIQRQRVRSNISFVWSCVLEDWRYEDLTNKCIAYKKVVSRTANSRVRRIMNKFCFQKCCQQIRITKE